jgi:Flp pilus assembly protein TadD
MPPHAVLGRLSHLFRIAAAVTGVACLASACASSKARETAFHEQKAFGAQMARKGFWREALFRFEKASAIKPDDPEIQNDLGVAYESVGESVKALTAYKRALELAPNDQKIKRNYARFAEYYTSVQRASSPLALAPAPTPTPQPTPKPQ